MKYQYKKWSYVFQFVNSITILFILIGLLNLDFGH